MAKTTVTSANYLTAALPPDRYPCGNKLYLVINPPGKKGEPGARHWQFIYWRGRRRKLGLGSAKAVKWNAAKALAMEKCVMLAKGIDPSEQRDEQRATDDRGPLFLDFAAPLRDRWKADLKHRASRAKLVRNIDVHAKPLHALRVGEIRNEQIITLVLDPLRRKPETLRDVRQRLNQIFRAAVALKIRADNPADYQSQVRPIMGRPAKRGLKRGRNKPLPYRDLPALMTRLAETPDQSARALAVTILTVARTAEIINMRWSQLDLGAALWTINAADVPDETEGGEGTKNDIDKVTALPRQAVAILRAMPRIGDYVFLGRDLTGPMSDATMLKRLKELTGDPDITVHGLRGCYRTWAQNETDFEEEIVEHVMHHITGDAAAKAYKHGRALRKRRLVLQAWADFATRPPTRDNVIAIPRRG